MRVERQVDELGGRGAVAKVRTQAIGRKPVCRKKPDNLLPLSHSICNSARLPYDGEGRR